jgi:hypothetical protein
MCAVLANKLFGISKLWPPDDDSRCRGSLQGGQSPTKGEQRSPIRGIAALATMARTPDGGFRPRGDCCGRVHRRLVGRHNVSAVEVVRPVEAAQRDAGMLRTQDDACAAADRSLPPPRSSGRGPAHRRAFRRVHGGRAETSRMRRDISRTAALFALVGSSLLVR